MQNLSDAGGFGFGNRCRIIPVHREIPAPSSRPSTAGEPTLLTTSPSSPDPIADPQNPPVSGSTHLDRIEAKVKAIQQQALDTQKKLEQLQANPVEETEAGLGGELPLSAGALVLAIALVAVAVFYFWKRQRWSNANDEDLHDRPAHSRFTPASKASPPFEASTPPPARTAAIAPDFADDSDSDWGVTHTEELEAQREFDTKAAASEVARVRSALAQRRAARELERAADARRLRELEEQEQSEAELDFPSWSDSKPFHEVLDVASDEAVASVAMHSAPVPFWQQSSVRGDVDTQPGESVTVQSGLAEPKSEELLSFDNSYEVKLALAKESAAVDLWLEARELIREVLESKDPELQAQAHALMATIERRKDKSRLGL